MNVENILMLSISVLVSIPLTLIVLQQAGSVC